MQAGSYLFLLLIQIRAYFAERMISGETLRRNFVMQRTYGDQVHNQIGRQKSLFIYILCSNTREKSLLLLFLQDSAVIGSYFLLKKKQFYLPHPLPFCHCAFQYFDSYINFLTNNQQFLVNPQIEIPDRHLEDMSNAWF